MFQFDFKLWEPEIVTFLTQEVASVGGGTVELVGRDREA